MAAQVSIYGKDSKLLDIRAAVLARAKFLPICSPIEDASGSFQMVHTKLSVVCNSLSPHEQIRVSSALLARWPDSKVLVIRQMAERFKSDPDGIYVCGHDPVEIVSTCKKLMDT